MSRVHKFRHTGPASPSDAPKIKAALAEALAARSGDMPVKGRMEAFVACDKLQEWRPGVSLGVDVAQGRRREKTIR